MDDDKSLVPDSREGGEVETVYQGTYTSPSHHPFSFFAIEFPYPLMFAVKVMFGQRLLFTMLVSLMFSVVSPFIHTCDNVCTCVSG